MILCIFCLRPLAIKYHFYVVVNYRRSKLLSQQLEIVVYTIPYRLHAVSGHIVTWHIIKTYLCLQGRHKDFHGMR